ncbi:MAG: CoA pyrophosphatase [Bacteroidota bacterium]
MAIAVPQQLETALKEKLPGFEAHKEMMPYKRISPEEAKETLTPRQSAVMLLLFPVNEEIHVLFIQRTEFGTHSGQLAFPGGKKDPEDQDLLDTAIRETWEEIGIAQDKITILGKLSEVYIPPSNFLAQPYVGWMDRFPDLTLQPAEVQQVLTISLKQLFDPENRKSKEMVLPVFDVTVDVPYFDVNGYTLWGATALMINEFRWIYEAHFP